MNISEWFTAHRRAEALRRLGGPDLDEERRKNAMNGDHKSWVMTVTAVAVLLGWLIWNYTNYQIAAAARAPTTAEVLVCVNQCATACAEHAERGEP